MKTQTSSALNKFPLPWTFLAFGEAQIAAKAAEGVFAETKITNDEIQGIVSNWSRNNDDASVLMILESYVKTIGRGKPAPISAQAIQIIASCFALTNAQDLDEQGFKLDGEKYFFLRRFGAVIEKAKALPSSQSSIGPALPPSQEDAEKIRVAVFSEIQSDRAKRKRNRGRASDAGRALVEAVRDESKKKNWNTAWTWLCKQADDRQTVKGFTPDRLVGETLHYSTAKGKQREIAQGTFSDYWRATNRATKKPDK